MERARVEQSGWPYILFLAILHQTAKCSLGGGQGRVEEVDERDLAGLVAVSTIVDL